MTFADLTPAQIETLGAVVAVEIDEVEDEDGTRSCGNCAGEVFSEIADIDDRGHEQVITVCTECGVDW